MIINYYLNENYLLSQWELFIISMRINYYLNENKLLSKWELIIISMRINYAESLQILPKTSFVFILLILFGIVFFVWMEVSLRKWEQTA